MHDDCGAPSRTRTTRSGDHRTSRGSLLRHRCRGLWSSGTKQNQSPGSSSSSSPPYGKASVGVLATGELAPIMSLNQDEGTFHAACRSLALVSGTVAVCVYGASAMPMRTYMYTYVYIVDIELFFFLNGIGCYKIVVSALDLSARIHRPVNGWRSACAP